MSTSNGYVPARNVLDELDKRKEEQKTVRDTGAHWSTRNDRPAAQASQPTSESGSKKAWTPEKRSIGGTGAGSVRTAPAQGHGGSGRSLDPPQGRTGSGRSLDAPQPSGAGRLPQGNLRAYNVTSLLGLGKGPISLSEADRLVQSGRANATTRGGQVYVTPSFSAMTPISSVDNQQGFTALQQPEQENRFNTGKFVKDIVNKGTADAAHGMSSTLSWLESALFALPEALTGFDDL